MSKMNLQVRRFLEVIAAREDDPLSQQASQLLGGHNVDDEVTAGIMNMLPQILIVLVKKNGGILNLSVRDIDKIPGDFDLAVDHRNKGRTLVLRTVKKVGMG